MRYITGISLFTILILFLTSASSSNQFVSDKDIYQKCLYPTIIVYDPGSSTAGSGFIVRSTKDGDKYKNIINATLQYILDYRYNPNYNYY